MRFIAGRAIFRHAVMVMITVAQPPVMISDQLWVHLSQPRLIASGFVDFHHRPRRQTRLGVALIPVGTVPAALGARVIGNKIGNKTGIPGTQRIAGLDLKRKHRTDIVFRHLRIEMGHRVRLFPGVPWPGLITREPAAGHRRRDRIKLHRACRTAPVTVKGLDGFYRHAFLCFCRVCVGQPFIQIPFPALFTCGEISVRMEENIGDFRLFLLHFGGSQQMRIGGVNRSGSGDVRLAGKLMTLDGRLHRQRFVDLIL